MYSTRKIPLNEVAALAGQELGVSTWHSITQERINLFAAATDNFTWIHVDVERAERERGGSIAHGFLILSLVPTLWHEICEITGFTHGFNYGIDKIRFINPVKAGDLIRLRATMMDPEAKRGGLIVCVKCVVERENEERPALVGDWREIYYTD